MILEKQSSVLGYPGEKSIPLDADHHGVCKFSSRHDPNYVAVRDALESLVMKAIEKGSSCSEGQVLRPTKPDPTISLEELLSIPEPSERDYYFFRDRWTPGTCDWVLDLPEFKSWHEDSASCPRILWMHGDAACGKSVISSFIINHLSSRGLPCQYFFVRFESKEKRSLAVMLRSLACQLSRRIPEYAEKLYEVRSAALDLEYTAYQNIWDRLYMQTLFKLTIKDPLFLVIDGLDEGDEPQALIGLLSKLQSTHIPFRILIVSRKSHEISVAFHDLESSIPVDRTQVETNVHDLRIYVERKLTTPTDPLYKENLISRIIEAARGNFLWVHFAIEKVNQCYTKTDVDDALRDIPRGMEAQYERMAIAVQTQSSIRCRKLGIEILGWVTCAQRPLSVEELDGALGDHDLLNIYNSLQALCGGFVVTDKEGKSTLIHETAHRYLMDGGNKDRPLYIDKRSTNDRLFERCIAILTDKDTPGKVHRNASPPFLDYAMKSWPAHLLQGSLMAPKTAHILMEFLQRPYVLRWINIAAKRKELDTLTSSARWLTGVAAKLRDLDNKECPAHRHTIAIVTGWAIDLVKIVGHFGHLLLQHPDAIFKLIPPFCPQETTIHRLFGQAQSDTISLSGLVNRHWGDCVSRLPFEEGDYPLAIQVTGELMFVLTSQLGTSHVFVYSVVTFQEVQRITHTEWARDIQYDEKGKRLVMFGYRTTTIWDMTTGGCIKTVKNPHSRVQTKHFDVSKCLILAGHEDRMIATLDLEDCTTEWMARSRIQDQQIDPTVFMSLPGCSAINPDRTMIVFGYHMHPITVWELDPPRFVGHCNMKTGSLLPTGAECRMWDVTCLVWHPFRREIFGSTRDRHMFKWDPYELRPSKTIRFSATCMAVSPEGSVIAVGSSDGTISLLSTADLSVLHEMTYHSSVQSIAFSPDSRRLYDVRGKSCNVWEPDILSDITTSRVQAIDTNGTSVSPVKPSPSRKYDPCEPERIITLSAQTEGPLYYFHSIYSTSLFDVDRTKLRVLDRGELGSRRVEVAWSGDGRFLAAVDDCSNLSVEKFTRTDNKDAKWHIESYLDMELPCSGVNPEGLLFPPREHRILVLTYRGMCVVDMTTKDVTVWKAAKPEDMCEVKWINHPKAAGYFLGFSKTKVQVHGWTDLQRVKTYIYFPAPSRGEKRFEGEFKLGRLLSNPECDEIIVQVLSVGEDKRLKSEYLIFSARDIKVDLEIESCAPADHDGHPDKEQDDMDDCKADRNTKSMTTNEANQNKEVPLSYKTIPPEVKSRIWEPLTIIPWSKFIFLDVDRWICTWELPTRSAKLPEIPAPIKQHYCLPGDWVTSNEAQLMQMSYNGTLFVPRLGGPTCVQYKLF